jgi:hypothetical protein
MPFYVFDSAGRAAQRQVYAVFEAHHRYVWENISALPHSGRFYVAALMNLMHYIIVIINKILKYCIDIIVLSRVTAIRSMLKFRVLISLMLTNRTDIETQPFSRKRAFHA